MPEIAGGTLFIGQPLIVYYGNRHIANSGAYDNSGEYFRNDLTVTSALKNSAGTTVTSSAVTLTNVAFTDGRKQGVYEGTMSGSISLTENSTYYLEITVVLSASTVDFVRIQYTAQYKGAS
jgi:hypothetical protein